MLTKKTYREVVRNLELYKKQHELDKKETPGAIPLTWGSSITAMIENTVRKNHERCSKGEVLATIEYLVDKGLLIRYLGDYTFPSNEPLPSREEVVKQTNELLDGIFGKE